MKTESTPFQDHMAANMHAMLAAADRGEPVPELYTEEEQRALLADYLSAMNASGMRAGLPDLMGAALRMAENGVPVHIGLDEIKAMHPEHVPTGDPAGAGQSWLMTDGPTVKPNIRLAPDAVVIDPDTVLELSRDYAGFDHPEATS